MDIVRLSFTRCGERFLCALGDEDHFVRFIAGKLLSEDDGWMM